MTMVVLPSENTISGKLLSFPKTHTWWEVITDCGNCILLEQASLLSSLQLYQFFIVPMVLEI